MNNWTNLSEQGIKCLEGMSHVHTSGIETFRLKGKTLCLGIDIL